MAIDRCVCFNVTFAELKRHADARRCDLDGLREAFGCARGCRLCEPYIKAMLKTGQTSFAADAPVSRPSDL